ncbi:hypothetical protein [Caballeronia sp. ATUFL_F2_KS9A]|uniref:hypothetical protein n=1 Tax=Caballeronia sp. ATUFL_F2_KS9A TaxID=2921777 RepID=UPI00202887C8|nr:hypothetical protein [Caballeronia sp. ATUFL_F2_KS9A]
MKRAIRATFVDWKDDRSCIDQMVGPAVNRASSRKSVTVTDGFIWLHLPTSALEWGLPVLAIPEHGACPATSSVSRSSQQPQSGFHPLKLDAQVATTGEKQTVGRITAGNGPDANKTINRATM